MATVATQSNISIKRGKSAVKSKEKTVTQQTQQDPNQQTQNVQQETGMGQSKNLLTKRYKKPAYMQSLNEAEKAENFKIIDNMNKKISYLKNPRFKVNKAPIILTQAGTGNVNDKNNPFRVEPQIVQFVDYQVNGVYEIPIKITNASKICRRIKFIPPKTDNFTVRNVKYPSKVQGDIAPGMSLIINISFCAPSFADFDDMLTFVTEDNSFTLPLRARRDPPLISLVNPLNCLHSWLGDRVDMAFRCVNNGGDGGFKFFCEKDEDDSKQTDADTIRIGPFTLTPSEFYLYAGNAIDIYVSFQPENEGQLEENLILACDNQTSEFYKLTGYGAKLDLDIVAVDGREVDYKKNPFTTLHFENTNPTSESRRVLTIKNSSPILVPFHWSFYKSKNANTISLQDELTHYRVEPTQGKLQGGQVQDFTLYFCPEHAEPYYEFTDLIVEDIPIQSIRNAPDGLKLFAAANAPRSRIPMPTYVGSNTQFLSIPIVQFNLRGQGNSCKIEIDPPIIFFEGDCFINYNYVKRIKLKKAYEGSVKYKLRLEGKNSEALSVDIKAQGQSLSTAEGGVIQSVIKSEKEIEVELTIKSSECGEKLAYFYIEVEDGPPLSFQCRATFKGPILKLIEPVIDYGLVKVNTQQKFRINIENTSPISTEIIIKNFKNKRMTFQNVNQFEKNEGEQMMDGFGTQLGWSKTSNQNQIKLDNAHRVLKPFEKNEILITLDSIKPESVEEYFEIMVKDSNSLFFQVLAEIQKPRVTLNRNSIDLGRIYAGITEVVDYDHKQALILKNYGNLPATFQWEEKTEGDRIVARFEPSRGTIPPKSEIKVYFSLTFFIGGNINELFICNINDVELPIGFELYADAFGLNVSYETTEDSTAAMSLTSSTFRQTQSQFESSPYSDKASMLSGGELSSPSKKYGKNKDKQAEANKLKMLNFPSCTINKTSTQKFILKNLSGIKTSFRFQSMHFEPLSHSAPQQKSEIQKAKEEEEARLKQMSETLQSSPDSKMGSPVKAEGGGGVKQLRFAPSAKSGSTKFGKSMKGQQEKMLARPILSDEHEQTAKFSSATGETFTQTKKLEKEQAFFLSNNKGIAIVFNPQMGDLPPHSEVPISVTIYNNVCGKFDDKIISEVKGLPPVEFPVTIAISGSPVVIPPNQVGLNYKTFPPTIPMPTIVTNSAPISKEFKIKNTGIRAVQIDWRIFDQQDLQQTNIDFFTMSVIKNLSYDRKENPFKFEYQAIEPEESQNSAFEINPKSYVIGSREIATFSVTFNSNKGVGDFKSILLASPELSKEELEVADDGDEFLRKGSLGIVSLNMQAMTIQPYLQIDKKVRMDGENHVLFKYWSVPNEAEAPSSIRKLTYFNETKADLTFNLNISGPFEIVNTKSNTGAKHPLATQQTQTKIMKSKKVETMFCLQPLKIIEISIKFLTPQASNNEEWPNIIKNERNGELIVYFQNGDSQKLILDGLLMRPKLDLLTEKPSKNDKAMDELNFGVVNVDRFRTIKVFLSNSTEVTAKWRLNYVKFPKKQTIGHSTTTAWELENMKMTDDPDVFEFSSTDVTLLTQFSQGSLKGRSLPLRHVPEGMAPPVPKDEYERQFLPQTILINFRIYSRKWNIM